MSGIQGTETGSTKTTSQASLSSIYPTNSYMELTITSAEQPASQLKVQGTVYTSDPVSNTIVLLRSLPHTTLSYDVQIINASLVVKREILHEAASEASKFGNLAPDFPLQSTDRNSSGAATAFSPINAAQLEERERRAVKLAMENLQQLNTRASPHAQLIFDLLVKGCNRVNWSEDGDGTSIIVLNQIRVDPPYTPDSCTWIEDTRGVGAEQKALDEGSLDRVKRIVGSDQARAGAKK